MLALFTGFLIGFYAALSLANWAFLRSQSTEGSIDRKTMARQIFFPSVLVLHIFHDGAPWANES